MHTPHFIYLSHSDGHALASNLLPQWTSLCLSPSEPGLKFLWDVSLEWITGSHSFPVSKPRSFSTMAVLAYTPINIVRECPSSYISLIAGLPLILANLLKVKSWESLHTHANWNLAFNELHSFIHILYWNSHLFYGFINFLYILDVRLLLILII